MPQRATSRKSIDILEWKVFLFILCIVCISGPACPEETALLIALIGLLRCRVSPLSGLSLMYLHPQPLAGEQIVIYALIVKYVLSHFRNLRHYSWCRREVSRI